jgi:hypothetical protein
LPRPEDDEPVIAGGGQACAVGGTQVTARTRLVCAVMVVVLCIVMCPNIRTVLSELAVARQAPSGDQAPAFTSSVWLARLEMGCPVAGSEIRTVWSVLALAPSGGPG